jgi:isoleucyl-tRNA synthetase
MKQIAAQINTLNAQDIAKIENDGEIILGINGKSVTLTTKDVEIISQDIEGWLVASSGSITVALDVTLNESLKNEGVARELVNRIQNLRKDSGFEVTDKIDIKLQHDGKVEQAVAQNMEYIKNETLAASLDLVIELNNGIDIEFDDVATRLSITKHN